MVWAVSCVFVCVIHCVSLSECPILQIFIRVALYLLFSMVLDSKACTRNGLTFIALCGALHSHRVQCCIYSCPSAEMANITFSFTRPKMQLHFYVEQMLDSRSPRPTFSYSWILPRFQLVESHWRELDVGLKPLDKIRPLTYHHLWWKYGILTTNFIPFFNVKYCSQMCTNDWTET